MGTAVKLSILIITVLSMTSIQADDGTVKLTEDRVLEDMLENQKISMQNTADTDTAGFRFTQRQQEGSRSMETFNRPEGTEAVVVPTLNNERSFHVRTSGQYGSYRKQQSWQRAVADDRIRNMLGGVQELKFPFPWILRNMPTPSGHGFGLNGFWNSYAAPDIRQPVPGFDNLASITIVFLLHFLSKMEIGLILSLYSRVV